MSNRVPYHGSSLLGVIPLACAPNRAGDEAPFARVHHIHEDLPADDPLWSIMLRQWQVRPEERPTMEEVIQAVSEIA